MPSSRAKSVNRRQLLRWGVVGLAVVVALVAWLATRGGDSESGPAPEAPQARVVSPTELREAAATLGQPIYWAGPIVDEEIVLKELGEGGGVQVAYLREGAEASEGTHGALTIGSYPLSDPQAAVKGYAGRPGSETLHGNRGTEVVVSQAAPTSAYFASPDNSVQVEVYDPSPKRAMSLALSGKVRPAG